MKHTIQLLITLPLFALASSAQHAPAPAPEIVWEQAPEATPDAAPVERVRLRDRIGKLDDRQRAKLRERFGRGQGQQGLERGRRGGFGQQNLERGQRGSRQGFGARFGGQR